FYAKQPEAARERQAVPVARAGHAQVAQGGAAARADAGAGVKGRVGRGHNPPTFAADQIADCASLWRGWTDACNPSVDSFVRTVYDEFSYIPWVMHFWRTEW